MKFLTLRTEVILCCEKNLITTNVYPPNTTPKLMKSYALFGFGGGGEAHATHVLCAHVTSVVSVASDLCLLLALCPLCACRCVRCLCRCVCVCVLCPSRFVRCVRCVHDVSVMSSASVESRLCLVRGEPKEDATKLKTVLFPVGETSAINTPETLTQ